MSLFVLGPGSRFKFSCVYTCILINNVICFSVKYREQKVKISNPTFQTQYWSRIFCEKQTQKKRKTKHKLFPVNRYWFLCEIKEIHWTIKSRTYQIQLHIPSTAFNIIDFNHWSVFLVLSFFQFVMQEREKHNNCH